MLTPPFSADAKDQIEIDISTRLSPRNQFVRWALRGLVGKMQYVVRVLETFDQSDEQVHVHTTAR